LGQEETQQFIEFCEILAAYLHFELHQIQERIKEYFAPFNPDDEIKQTQTLTASERQEMAQLLIDDFSHILERANYYPLTEEQLNRAFDDVSLIDVKTNIDFDEFEQRKSGSFGPRK